MMSDKWEDYYAILQVHFMAEPEIIKSAYLRLARKYHPDVNPSDHAEGRMKAINRAYEVLGDPVNRKQYLVRWMENFSALRTYEKSGKEIHPLDFTVEPGKRVLLSYLERISNKDFSGAFQLISEEDKGNIPQMDFIKWQEMVSEVFQLLDYSCELQGVYGDMSLGGKVFETVLELEVQVHENNLIMGRHEEDLFTKCVVLEEGSWRVFLGYQDLSGVIGRFNELASLKNRRTVSRVTLKKRPGFDSIHGAMKRKEFYDKALYEQKRFNRYGNRFSVVFCVLGTFSTGAPEDLLEIKGAGAVISGKIRDLDICCRWKENVYAILLPETQQVAARKVASKIKRALDDQLVNTSVNVIVVEQRYPSLQELFSRVERGI